MDGVVVDIVFTILAILVLLAVLVGLLYKVRKV